MHSFSTELWAVWLLLLLPAAIAEFSDIAFNGNAQEWRAECENYEYQLPEHTSSDRTLSVGEISKMLQEKFREISEELKSDWQMDQIDENEIEQLMQKMQHVFSATGAPDFDRDCGDNAQLEAPTCEAV